MGRAASIAWFERQGHPCMIRSQFLSVCPRIWTIPLPPYRTQALTQIHHNPSKGARNIRSPRFFSLRHQLEVCVKGLLKSGIRASGLRSTSRCKNSGKIEWQHQTNRKLVSNCTRNSFRQNTKYHVLSQTSFGAIHGWIWSSLSFLSVQTRSRPKIADQRFLT